MKGPDDVPAGKTPPSADDLPNPDQKASLEFEAARSAEDDDLEEGLTALSHLATGRMGLKETLLRVAQCASRAIPGASGVGLTLIEKGRADTIVATESFVTEMDAVQYDLKQGPCITAVADEQPIISGSIASDPRWPEFGPQSAGCGVQSSLSIPLITSDGVIGSLNVYAHEKNVFDDRAALLGGYFGVPAAIAVQNAQILAESKRLALHLRKALSNRITVERAIGVLMTRSGESPDEAMAKIRTISHTEHKKIDLVAQDIVDTAVRRAHARRIG
ncbi:MAG TPA: GAF and ANTAR domain-containing protein [Propionibacteriaceae bacterium]|nr:GAF and ANTAR domain-containing protein [Propionibacteriaceae bacterium]